MDDTTYQIRRCPFCKRVSALKRGDAGKGKWKACDRCTASILAPLRASETAHKSRDEAACPHKVYPENQCTACLAEGS